jgi:hypothetical protein
MPTLTQSVAATAGQIKQITRVGTDALEKAIAEFGLDKDGAQRVHMHGNEFAAAISAAVIASLKDLSVTGKYKGEEVASTRTYPSGYKVKPISEQLKLLSDHLGLTFPRGVVHALTEQPLPRHAEGYFVIPKWQSIAPTYGEAVAKVLAALKKSRTDGPHNNCGDKLGPSYLRQTPRAITFFEQLAAEQPDHDALVVPAQFGLLHRGCSVRRAIEVCQANEFGLGAFAVGIMLLTHPERFTRYEDLCVDCAGDECAPNADGVFSNAPLFGWVFGRLGFASGWWNRASDRFGTVSGFVSQQQ